MFILALFIAGVIADGTKHYTEGHVDGKLVPNDLVPDRIQVQPFVLVKRWFDWFLLHDVNLLQSFPHVSSFI